MQVDLRCPSRKHGVLVAPGPGGAVEVKCNSDRCGASRKVVVLHLFDTASGELIRTQRFRNPQQEGRA